MGDACGTKVHVPLVVGVSEYRKSIIVCWWLCVVLIDVVFVVCCSHWQ